LRYPERFRYSAISFDVDEEMPEEERSHMLDAFAHAAGHGPHPGKYRPKPKKGPADTKPRESFEDFCRRLGIKLVREKGGVQFVPGTFLVKQLKKKE
jgi:hypothetical protein